MALIPTLIALGLWKRDPNLAAPAPEAEWIHGSKWDDVRGQPIAKIEGSAWAPVRAKR
jgi:hypothetical protein